MSGFDDSESTVTRWRVKCNCRHIGCPTEVIVYAATAIQAIAIAHGGESAVKDEATG